MPRPQVTGDVRDAQSGATAPHGNGDRLSGNGHGDRNGRRKIFGFRRGTSPTDDTSAVTAPAVDSKTISDEQPKRRFFGLRSSSKKRKRPRKQTRRGVATKWGLILLFLFLIAGTVRGIRASNALVKERAARTVDEARIEGQLKELGASSVFPLEDAVAKARRLAYECFTVPNAGATAITGDFVGLQNKALADDGIPAGSKINCGWDGKGRGKVDDMQVVKDPYWIHADRATIVLQIKLYQRRGFFYYYVPFTNSNGVAEYAGMPAIFGTASGAENFMNVCKPPENTLDTKDLQQTAQLFLTALAGEGDFDLGYLTYKDAWFGGFGPTVSSPVVRQVTYCGAVGNERRFAAIVQFKGPVLGSTYTLPYAFSVVANPNTSGKYQVKHFGPAPGYIGD
jgi:hypothetical protein